MPASDNQDLPMVNELHQDHARADEAATGAQQDGPRPADGDGYEARLPRGRGGLLLALLVALLIGVLFGPLIVGVFGGVFGMIMGLLGGIYGLAVGILALVLTGFMLILPALLLIALGYGLAVMLRSRNRNGA